ncbi:pectate lyase superfamily protein-domain-containing protein [Alternaria rosae]|uniref:pectate lyase superfamily protein-domain-containing protein n=1 Tax=Alternaria rosae TaxID=1187941 RepID=UPI001E8DA690|nr:pectate lyase superfamily protein-domain-containing protein [Alternaria rosae]KAH6876298.1 pectate lyase superfamily protein-domain-containing protein [Alternaria rosae]
MKSLRVLAWFSGLHHLSTAYNTPAPPDATRQNPFAYHLNWTPANPVHGAQSEFWLPNVPHNGKSPFLLNAPNYHVYRNVKDFGAVGNGVHGDTDAFNAAIDYGSRCAGSQCNGGSTGKPALIYVPPGTYAIYPTIQLYISTQIIEDAINVPTLKAASSAFNNTAVVDGYDKDTQSTNNFYIGLRNFNIDITAADAAKTIYALNWAVSQATNLIDVNFNMPNGSNHIGIEMDGGTSGGGSGLFIGDLTFSGGLIGLQFRNQQYSPKNLKFTNVATAIAITHGLVITMQQINCINRSGPLLVINGTTTAQGSLVGQTYISGHVYKDNNGQAIVSNGTKQVYPDRGSLADASGRYFTKPQPQYTEYPASAFASVKDAGAKGDGQTDNTAAINAALKNNADCKITYFPHGVYSVTDTIYDPPGSRVVGEAWSVISAAGNNVSDEANPQPMIQIGKPDEVGLAELSDMLFTVSDVLPGAILVEVNMRGSIQGDMSFHNTHYRIVGAADSRTETACESETQPCKAAFLVMHLRKTSSAYIENSWLWTADHDLDGANPTSVGTGRGMFVEATTATWLVGTSSEHHTLYGYTLHNAQNVMASLMQAPYPWTPNATWYDPTFEGCSGNISQCYMSWSVRIPGPDTRSLALYGMGFWVFSNGPGYAACLGLDGICQVNIPGSAVRLYNVNTKGVQNLISFGGSKDSTTATQAANPGSSGGVVAAFLSYRRKEKSFSGVLGVKGIKVTGRYM